MDPSSHKRATGTTHVAKTDSRQEHVDISDKLIIRKGLTLVQTLPLENDVLSVGRAPGVNVLLDHPSVSRNHAEILRRGAGWEIADKGSTNGILVNGERVQRGRIYPGDVIEIRPFTLHYQSDVEQALAKSLILSDSSAVTSLGPRNPSAHMLVRQRLEELYSLARIVIKREAGGTVWPAIQNSLQRTLQAERCVLIGVDVAGEFFRLHPPGQSTSQADPLHVSNSVLQDVVCKQGSVLVERVAAHAQFAGAMSLAGGGVGSVLCVPVVMNNSVRAVVYAERPLNAAPFRDEDLSYVTAAVDLAAAAVELDELHDKARELAHVSGRIAAAREIQEMLLPNPVPQPAWGQVAALNEPADGMSGDIFDVALDAQGRLVTMLADVAGKGVPAAFITSALQNTLRLSLAEDCSVEQIVRRMNAALDAHQQAGLFATAILARWSADGQTVEIANCGHHAPLWLAAEGNVSAFPERVGLPLGVSPKWKGQVEQIRCEPYERFITFSDGVTEARNRVHDEYGAQRAVATLQKLGKLPAAELAREFAKDVVQFCDGLDPPDDLTLVVVQRDKK
ncbi:MAG: SpoIIE family protein phosphatase [Phycisphaerae bacterium]